MCFDQCHSRSVDRHAYRRRLPAGLCFHLYVYRVHVFVCLMTNERRIPQSLQRRCRQPLVIILWEAVPDVGTTTCNAYTLSRHSVGFSSHLSTLLDVNTYTTHTCCLCGWWDSQVIQPQSKRQPAFDQCQTLALTVERGLKGKKRDRHERVLLKRFVKVIWNI